MDKTQEKFFKLLKLLDDCRNKLRATYNLFVSCLEQAKSNRAEMQSLYEQMLDCKDTAVQIVSSNKPAKTKLSRLSNEVTAVEYQYSELYNKLSHCMDDCESCRKTYKHEVSLCCQTYNVLKEKGISASIVKGYKQQVKLIRAVLNKIDEVKDLYKNLKTEVKEEKTLFDKLCLDVKSKMEVK